MIKNIDGSVIHGERCSQAFTATFHGKTVNEDKGAIWAQYKQPHNGDHGRYHNGDHSSYTGFGKAEYTEVQAGMYIY